MDLGFLGGFEIFGQRYERRDVEIVWANELNPAACRTYKANFDHPIVCGDIWQHLDDLPNSVDVLIGGFPCQDISINGKGAGVAGARSGLYRAMVEAVRVTKPRAFVAENVKGLLMRHNADSLAQIYRDFEALGYEVTHSLYNAADYGVPQSRERVFIVGMAKDEPAFVPPRPDRESEQWRTARDAIHDLAQMPYDESTSHIWSAARKSSEQGNRSLKADRPGYTIRAECHGNIQFHYEEPRRISMREAARIQSFPDSFVFESKLRETERQVGNAVPPILAWHVAGALLESLETKT